MCNLGEGIRERAEISTEIRTKAQAIIDLMDSMGIDIDKAMQLLKIDPEEKEMYKEKVDELLSQVAV